MLNVGSKKNLSFNGIIFDTFDTNIFLMKNKIRNVIVCLFVSQIILSQEATSETTLNWVSSYDEALSKSKEEKKPILIYFKGSDWCGPCKVLDA